VIQQRIALQHQLRHQRRAGAGQQAPRRLVDVPVKVNNDLDAVACPGGGTREGAVDAGADPDGVEPATRRQLLLEGRDDLALEADEPVGDEDDLALGAGAQGREGLQDAGAHLGAALGLEPLDPGEGLLLRGLGGPGGPALPAVRAVAEGEQLELVGVLEGMDEGAHQGPGLLYGSAIHGTAGVEEEDEIPRHSPGARGGGRRDNGEEAEGVAAGGGALLGARGLQREADAGLRDGPADGDVAVQAGLVGEVDLHTFPAGDREGVGGRGDLSLDGGTAPRAGGSLSAPPPQARPFV
jgi:hypothetical protein